MGVMFARRTNLIAGGNATGSESTIPNGDPERVELVCDPSRVGAGLAFDPWTLSTAIEFHASGVNTRSLPLAVRTDACLILTRAQGE